jgi:hypothetical protein
MSFRCADPVEKVRLEKALAAEEEARKRCRMVVVDLTVLPAGAASLQANKRACPRVR